jgi:PAS domain S-box-containing protein
MVDNNRIIRFWNKAAEKLYGYSRRTSIGTQMLLSYWVYASPEEADEVSKVNGG